MSPYVMNLLKQQIVYETQAGGLAGKALLGIARWKAAVAGLALRRAAMCALGVLVLALHAPTSAQAVETYPFNGLNRSIPDGNFAGLKDVHVISSSAIRQLSSVRVKLRIDGEYNGDLYGYLRLAQPGRTTLCVLLNRPGRTAIDLFGYEDNGLDITFDDSPTNPDIHTYRNLLTPATGSALTGIWQSDGRMADPLTVLDTTERTRSLTQFNGADANGEWTLYLADCDSGGDNLLVQWELDLGGAVQPLITWPTPASIVYGTPLSGSQLNATATYAGNNVSGTFAYTPSASTILDAGSGRTLAVVFTPSDASSYLGASGSVLFDVTKAPLAVTVNGLSRAYGVANPAFIGTVSGIQNSDPISVGYTSAATPASPVGSYSITPVLSDPDNRLPNYTVATTAGTLTVTAASLTVTADNKTRKYGDPNPPLTGSIVGIKNGDSITATYSTTADAGSPPGTYPITIALVDPDHKLGNYLVTLNAGTLTILSPPTITAQPQSQTVIAGASVTFSVGAAGTLPITYQWRFNGSDIAGVTASSYTLTNAQPAKAGDYSVLVSNSGGSTLSSTAALSVNVTLSANTTAGGTVSKAPEQSSYAPNTVVTLTATPQSFYAFTGWSGDASGTVNPLPVTMTANKSITANFASIVADVIVDNPAATFTGTWTTTSTATDKYGADYRYASSVTASATATATFTPNVVTSGRYDVYVWYPTVSKSAGAVPVLVSYSGGSQTFTVNQTAGAGSWQLIGSGLKFASGTTGFLRISNNVGQNAKNVAADAVRLAFSTTQDVPPAIVTQPQSVVANQGQNVTFTVVATGTAPLGYQWRFKGADLSGAIGSALTLNNVQMANAGNYDVIVSNIAGIVTSSIATLALDPGITTQPLSQAVVSGGSVTFTVTATGTSPFSYQWRFNGANRIGATSGTLTLNNVQSGDAGNYDVVVSNAKGTITSSVAVLTVALPPTVTLTSPAGGSVFGAPATIGLAATVTANGNTINKVQFYYNSTTLIGGDTASPYSYTWSSVTRGSYTLIARVVYNGTSTVDSAPVAVTVAGLSSPWLTADIGTVSAAGGAYDYGGAYTVAGAGNIGGKADNFRFVYQALTADGEIKVRLPVVGNSSTSQRIGVMIRETPTSGSREAFMGVGSSGSYFSINRTSTGGNASSTSSATGTYPNVWVRLVRTGNTVTAYKSADGNTWTQVSSQSITMASSIYIGFAVSSGASTTLNTSQFDNVTVTP